MSTRERPIDRANRHADRDRIDAGRTIHDARVAAGLSLRAAAHAAASSASQFARLERGQVASASIAQMARHAAAVGLDARLRLYPGPDPVRDAGQNAVRDRFRLRLAESLRLLGEVPIGEGDLRAFHGMVVGFAAHRRLPVEFETRFADGQAQIRRLLLKATDGGFEHLLIVVADTRLNRDAVRAAESLLRDTFALSKRVVLRALAEGRYPGGSALILL
jgi:transcriptional regulator with XRE-family HTH domain